MPHAFGFTVSNSWLRQSNAFEKPLYNAPKYFPLLALFFSIFLTLLKGSVHHNIRSEIRIGILRNHCQRKQIFEQFLFNSVTSARFKELGNIDDLNTVLIILQKKSAKISAFC